MSFEMNALTGRFLTKTQREWLIKGERERSDQFRCSLPCSSNSLINSSSPGRRGSMINEKVFQSYRSIREINARASSRYVGANWKNLNEGKSSIEKKTLKRTLAETTYLRMKRMEIVKCQQRILKESEQFQEEDVRSWRGVILGHVIIQIDH